LEILPKDAYSIYSHALRPYALRRGSELERRRARFGFDGAAVRSAFFGGHTIANLFMTLSLVQGMALLDLQVDLIMVAATFSFGVELRRR
jgi:hypothetical protein